MKWILCCVLSLAAGSLAAQTNQTNALALSEQIRHECIQGRRHICGRVLEVTKAGLVVDSGYPQLLRPPFNRTWVTRGVVSLHRPAALLERDAPDAIAVGLVFVSDFPRRPAVHQYDYVALNGYPAGTHTYAPAPGVTKTIRHFSGGLETAVRLDLPAAK